MKFGKYVQEHAVPEWATEYINYRELKKRIKNITQSENAIQATIEFEEALNSELEKISLFYLKKEREATDFFNRLQRFATRLAIIDHKHFLHDDYESTSYNNISNNNDNNDNNNNNNKNFNDNDNLHVELEVKSPLLSTLSSDSFSFSPSLLSPSYGTTDRTSLLKMEDDSKSDKKRDKNQQHLDDDHDHNFIKFLQGKFIQGLHYSEHLLVGITQTLKHPTWKHEGEGHKNAKKQLAMATALEYYRGLVLLKNYAIINFTGFVKICKKSEKVAHLPSHKEKLDLSFYIASQPFHSSKEIDRLMNETENIFGNSFLEGDTRKAKRVLRIPDQDDNTTRSFGVGTMFGVNIMLTIILLYIVVSNAIEVAPYNHISKINFPRYKSVYTMFSALGLPILWLCIFGADILIWTKQHINYAFIFEMDPRWKLSYSHCLEAVMSLTLMWLLSIALYIWMSTTTFPLPHPPAEWIPLILFSIFIFIIVCPFDVFFKKGRYWFLHILAKIATVPFRPVKFKDFFLADQLVSMSLVLVQLEFLFCFYANDVWYPEEQAVCFKKQPLIAPYLSALPAIWRLLQCFRRFYDSKDKLHLINSGKYVCSILVVILAALDDGDGFSDLSTFRICWIIAATINSLYAYTWDILMDWSFLTYRNGKFSFRKRRIYPYTIIYVWAALSNFVLRFTWSLTKSNLLQLSRLVKWPLVELIAAVEILRRFQWNLFRLENEHLNIYILF